MLKNKHTRENRHAGHLMGSNHSQPRTPRNTMGVIDALQSFEELIDSYFNDLKVVLLLTRPAFARAVIMHIT